MEMAAYFVLRDYSSNCVIENSDLLVHALRDIKRRGDRLSNDAASKLVIVVIHNSI